jgi:hypothetical protein
MALRDRQISGIPLTRLQSEIISHAMTVLVPILGYKVWYPFLHIPQELWLVLAVISTAIHLAMSVQIVPNNVERNLLWFGSYTGASFPNGICFIPRLPFPIILLVIRVLAGDEIYRKILWSLEGDVSIKSTIVSFIAEGMTRDGARVRIKGKLRLEVESAAIISSQGFDSAVDGIVAEYTAGVKTAVISQHSVEELMRGYHSGGSSVLTGWMTDAWQLVHTFGMSLASAPIAEVEILSKHVEQAWDRARGEEIFTAGAKSLARSFTAYRAENPNLSEEVAWASFAASQGLPPWMTIDIVKFK